MDMGIGEESVRCMERVTRKLTLPYVKEIAKGNLLYGSGNSNRGSVAQKKQRHKKSIRRDLRVWNRKQVGNQNNEE